MIANKAVKIFVEPDEEIVFIVEKIIKANTGRVILIVPNTAALISSAVSLKILSRQMLKHDRLAVLVSDTDLAKNLGEKARIMVCRKVSEVTKDAWQTAKELKEKYGEEIEKIKKELLSARREAPGDPLRVEDLIGKVFPGSKELKSSGDKAYGLANVEDNSKLERVKAVIVEDPEPQLPVIKPRLKERVVDINGLKLFAGGDILNNKELLDMERRRNNQVLEIKLETEDNINIENENDDMYKDSGLLGVDMTKQLNQSRYSSSGHRPKPKKHEQPAIFKKIGEFFTSFFAYVSIGKLLSGVVIAILLFLLISYFFFTSAKVEIKLASATFSVKKTITAKVDDKNAYDAVAMIVSAATVVKDATTSSESPTTGDGVAGDYAQGDLLIYNPTSADVVLKAGQVFTYNYGTTPLKFRSLVDTTIPAAAPKTNTVKVKADSPGENYNITSTLKSFLTEGHAEVTAQNITNITGGTTVPTKVVSKTDIDDLKLSMIDKLKTQLIINLKAALGDDDVLLDGSEKFTENTFTTSVKEGTPIEKFTADLKMTVSATIVSRTEVKKLLTEVAVLENGYSRVEMNDPVVENPKITDKVVTFDVKANAVGMTDLDLEQVKTEIKGKGVTEAKDLIKAKSGVESVIVIFTPPYIPIAIQKIPTEDTKLEVTITSK